MRFDQLKDYLSTLTQLNQTTDVNEEIQNTILEINQELGIGTDSALSSYSTGELHNELEKRAGITSILINPTEEATVSKIVGQEAVVSSFSGPARILINQD